MSRTIVHVNQHVLRHNAKTGDRKPVLTVKRGRKNPYCHEVEILGPAKVVYADGVCQRPLSCGARCWVQTEAEVKCITHDEGKA